MSEYETQPAPAEPEATLPKVHCKIHGVNPWNGEIKCDKCGATYTTKDPDSPMNAPPRCTLCARRLLPVMFADGRPVAKPGAHKYFTMIPCCSLCFAAQPGGALAVRHARDSKFCLGEACPSHGPQIRKLQRRAERAAWAAKKKIEGETIVSAQTPGGQT
jgi:hypothetical protein